MILLHTLHIQMHCIAPSRDIDPRLYIFHALVGKEILSCDFCMRVPAETAPVVSAGAQACTKRFRERASRSWLYESINGNTLFTSGTFEVLF